MKKVVLTYLVVITIFISNALCFGNEEKSHICFRAVDADKDGKVTFQEFKEIYGDDKVKFKAIDLNDDGKLSHDEYHQFLGHGSS
jgi:Ca2+-binding EF-hand superfamily protein